MDDGTHDPGEARAVRGAIRETGTADPGPGADGDSKPVRLSNGGRRGRRVVAILLLAFGAYQSVLYFGFRPVPNSDFCAFVKTGEELLSLHLPSSYKRAPVTCVLLVGLSRLVGGPHPELNAGWLLNAFLHPFNLLLLWLLARRVAGPAAACLAVVAILNPVAMDLLSDPVAETTLLFCTLLTLHLICRGSRWSYLMAAVTTMVRYEGAALIVAALVVDIMEHRARADRLRALARAALASAPLGLWMIGTAVSLRSGTWAGVHYLESLGAMSGGKLVLAEFVKVLSRVAFSPLLELRPPAPGWTAELLRRASQAAGLAALGAGAVAGVLRRDRTVLTLSIFLWLYVAVHALHPFVYPRFCANVAGVALLVAWAGAAGAWTAVRARVRVPERVRSVAMWAAFALAGVWLAWLVACLPDGARLSERSASVPYAATALVALLALGRLLEERGKNAAGVLGAALAAGLVIVSNQFTLTRVVGDGRSGSEYRELAEWFRASTRPGEGLVCANTCAVELYAPERKRDLTHFFFVKVGSPAEFAERCREMKLAYVAWDSDTGQDVGSYYYRLFRYENIDALRQPRSTGPYEFVEQISSPRGNRINLFRIVAAPTGTLQR